MYCGRAFYVYLKTTAAKQQQHNVFIVFPSPVRQQLVFNSVTNCLGPRKFLHSGKLFKAKSSKELYGFLFNDFLLLTQVSLVFLLVCPFGTTARRC